MQDNSTAPWTEKPFTAFDLETTSPDPLTARIVTACVTHVHGNTTDTRTWLADPGVDIPEGATAVHGVTTDHARAHGQDHDTVAYEVAAALTLAWAAGRVVVAYNASYDLTILHRFTPALVVGHTVDPFVIDRHVDAYRKGSRTLTATCAHYGITLTDAHTAEADTLAAARLAWVLGRRFPALAVMTADDLHTAQAGWHRDRQASYAEYLIRKGQDTDAARVDGAWPLRVVAA